MKTPAYASASLSIAASLLALLVFPLQAQETPRPPTQLLGFELSDLVAPARWRAGDEETPVAGGARQAILVLADQAEEAPPWFIPFARSNLRPIRDALVRWGGVAEGGLQVLQGQQVQSSGLRRAIERAAERFRGSGNLLVLYYSGHGYTDASQAPVLFTYDTRWNAATSGFDEVIRHTELGSWVAMAKRTAQERGAEFQTLLIVDACRPNVFALQPAARITPIFDWEWYGVSRGQLAAAPLGADPSPFTGAVVDAMAQLARVAGESSLEQLAARVSRQVRERTAQAQVPELLRVEATAQTPVLVQPSRIGIGVTVVDAVTHQPLPAAGVQIGRHTLRGVGVVQLPPGRHLVRVSAPGYLTRSEELDVGPEQAGQVLEVPVHPGMLLVRGVVSPRRAVFLRWRDEGAIPGYHVTEVTSGADGGFALRLPEGAGGTTIELVEAGRVVHRIPLPRTAAGFVRPPTSAYEGVPSVNVGTVLLPEGLEETGVVYVAARSTPETRVQLPEGVSDALVAQPPELRGEIDRGTFGAVARHAANQDWRRARVNLSELLAAGSVSDPATRRSLEGLLAWVAVQEALALASSDSVGRLIAEVGRTRPGVQTALRAITVQLAADEAIRAAEAPGSASPALRKLAALLSAMLWGYESGSYWVTVAAFGSDNYVAAAAKLFVRLMEAGAWSEALRATDEVSSAGWIASDSIVRRVAPIALRHALQEAIANGLRNGDWGQAEALVRRVRAAGSADTALADLVQTVRDEGIPLSTRREFETAQRAFAEGSLEEAWAGYGRALTGANAHYSRRIEEQREYLRQRLYVEHVTKGEAAEIEGDSVQSLAEYLAASQFDPRVDARVGALLDRRVRADPVVLRAWRRRQAELARTPSLLRVTTDPPDAQVNVGGQFYSSRTPAQLRLQAAAGLVVEVVRGTARSSVTIDVPPGSLVSVTFELPLDTVPLVVPRSRDQLVDHLGLLANWQPQRPRPERPRYRSAPDRDTPMLFAFLAGGLTAWLLVDIHRPGLIVPGALVLGMPYYYPVRWLMGGIASARNTAYRNYEQRLHEWEQETAQQRERWLAPRLEQAARAESQRVAAENARIHAQNEQITARNAGLGPPTVVVEPLYEGIPSGAPSREGRAAGGARGGGAPAQVGGTWEVTLETPTGATQSTMTVTQDTASFTGTMSSPMGTVSIDNGQVQGSLATWSIAITVGGQPMTVSFRGEVQGNRMRGTAEMGGFGSSTFTTEKRP